MTPKRLINISEQEDEEKSPKELADEQSAVVFEDDDVLFLKIYSYPALTYYGPDKYKEEQYSNEIKTQGDKYLIIDKKGDKLSFYMNVPRYGTEYIEGYNGNTYLFSDIIDTFPKITLYILDRTDNYDTHYGMLLRIKYGKQLERWDIRNKTNNFIWEIEYSEKNPSKSMVTLNFTHDEYFNSFKFAEEGDRGYLDLAIEGSSGYGYRNEIFYDESNEWTEGYMMRYYFNESSMVLVRKILKYLNPGLLRKLSENNDSVWEQASRFLDDTFDYEISDIVTEFTDLKNQGAYELIKENVVEEFADIFLRYAIFRTPDQEPFNMYFTTVGRLVSLYETIKDRSVPLVSENQREKTLFRTLGRKLGEFGGYHEMAYEQHSFDEDKFNENIESTLNNIIDKIEENPELYNTKIAELYEQLEKLGYEVGKTYKLPTDETKSFRIDDVDMETQRIKISHIGNTVERRSYSIDEFKNYISSGELFERLVRKLKKLL